MERPEFKTLKSYSIDFGTRNFIELALKEASEGSETNRFISISKGYTDQEGRNTTRGRLVFATSAEVIDFFIKSFPKLKKEVAKLPAIPAETEEKAEEPAPEEAE